MLPDTCRVTTIQVLFGVTITNHLSVSDHIRDVISKCSLSLYALKVLRCHGMNDEALRQVYKAAVITKCLYESPAWWGYATAADKQRVEAFIRRGVRLGLYRADNPTTTQLATNNNDNLFSSLLTNGHHVLKQLLPDKTNYQYNLRNRRHNLSLTVKTVARNFAVTQLFKDIYKSHFLLFLLSAVAVCQLFLQSK